MTGRQTIAYALIALGGLALLARVGPGTGWLWVALAAAGFLAAFRQQRTYAFLVVGSLLAGVSAGLLLEGAWGWPGAFLVCLGAGFLAIDRVEPRPSRWPIYPAAVLVGVGVIYWLFRAGIIQSLWFPILLIIAGIYLLRQPRRGQWVETEEPASDPSTEASGATAHGAGAPAGPDPSARDREGAAYGRVGPGGVGTGNEGPAVPAVPAVPPAETAGEDDAEAGDDDAAAEDGRASDRPS